MAIYSQGSNMQSALMDALRQALQQGGTQAQDPDARAFADAEKISKRSGDVLGGLQALGRDNVLDPTIAALQKQGEQHGYTNDIRSKINEARKFQSGAAMDAQTMGKVNISRGGGGGLGGFSGGMQPVGGDELTLLAQLLGRYRGNYNSQTNTQGVGIDPFHKQGILDEDHAMISQLQPIYDELLKQKQMETQAMQDKIRGGGDTGSSASSSAGFVNDLIGQNKEDQTHDWRGNLVNNPNSPNSSSADPYRQVRNATLAAALRAIGRF